MNKSEMTKQLDHLYSLIDYAHSANELINKSDLKDALERTIVRVQYILKQMEEQA